MVAAHLLGFWYGWPVGKWWAAWANFLGRGSKGDSCPCQDGSVFCCGVCTVIPGPWAVTVACISHVKRQAHGHSCSICGDRVSGDCRSQSPCPIVWAKDGVWLGVLDSCANPRGPAFPRSCSGCVLDWRWSSGWCGQVTHGQGWGHLREDVKTQLLGEFRHVGHGRGP